MGNSADSAGLYVHSELCDLHKWVGLNLGICTRICILKLEGTLEGKEHSLGTNCVPSIMLSCMHFQGQQEF